MAAPEGTRQVTLFIPSDLLEDVDDCAYRMRQRRNDRTTWVVKAIEEKLARDAALTFAEGEPEEEKRLKEIVSTYTIINDDGKEWLYNAARAAGAFDGFAEQ